MMDVYALPRREHKEPIMAWTELMKLIIGTLGERLDFACALCECILKRKKSRRIAHGTYLVLTLTVSFWDLEELSCW
jgi:hypothetical protein